MKRLMAFWMAVLVGAVGFLGVAQKSFAEDNSTTKMNPPVKVRKKIALKKGSAPGQKKKHHHKKSEEGKPEDGKTEEKPTITSNPA